MKNIHYILANHKLWLKDSTKGQRLVVEGLMLVDQVFQNHDFRMAIFRPNAILNGAKFYGCNFCGVSWESNSFVNAYFTDCLINLGRDWWMLDTDAPDSGFVGRYPDRSFNIEDYQTLLDNNLV